MFDAQLAKTIGDRLRDIRSDYGHSQGEMAKRMGMSSSQLSRLEQGRHLPEIRFLLRLATLYKANLAWVMGKDASPAYHKRASDILLLADQIRPLVTQRAHDLSVSLDRHTEALITGYLIDLYPDLNLDSYAHLEILDIFLNIASKDAEAGVLEALMQR